MLSRSPDPVGAVFNRTGVHQVYGISINSALYLALSKEKCVALITFGEIICQQTSDFSQQTFQFTDKSAIVTGSSRGIGRAIAIELARQGADVLINYNQNRDARRICTTGSGSTPAEKPLSSKRTSATLTHTKNSLTPHTDAFGKVDILINNAGITRIADILEETPEQFDLIVNTNLKATHFLTQRVAKLHGRKRGSWVYYLYTLDFRYNGI